MCSIIFQKDLESKYVNCMTDYSFYNSILCHFSTRNTMELFDVLHTGKHIQ